MNQAAVFLLLLNIGSAAAVESSGLCYILDGILIIYGIILTVLYCRLRMRGSPASGSEENQEDGIYQGLKSQTQDTYETLNVRKKGAS